METRFATPTFPHRSLEPKKKNGVCLCGQELDCILFLKWFSRDFVFSSKFDLSAFQVFLAFFVASIGVVNLHMDELWICSRSSH